MQIHISYLIRRGITIKLSEIRRLHFQVRITRRQEVLAQRTIMGKHKIQGIDNSLDKRSLTRPVLSDDYRNLICEIHLKMLKAPKVVYYQLIVLHNSILELEQR